MLAQALHKLPVDKRFHARIVIRGVG